MTVEINSFGRHRCFRGHLKCFNGHIFIYRLVLTDFNLAPTGNSVETAVVAFQNVQVVLLFGLLLCWRVAKLFRRLVHIYAYVYINIGHLLWTRKQNRRILQWSWNGVRTSLQSSWLHTWVLHWLEMCLGLVYYVQSRTYRMFLFTVFFLNKRSWKIVASLLRK